MTEPLRGTFAVIDSEPRVVRLRQTTLGYVT